MMYVISGTEEGIHSSLAQFFGLRSEEAPALFIVAPMQNMNKFKYPGSILDLTIEDIQKFENDFKKGKL